MSKNKTYSEKLRDPRWQRKRLEVLNGSKFKCADCESEDKTLHVHHGIYLKNHEPWEYEVKTLHCLCEECHENREMEEGYIKMWISEMKTEEIGNIVSSILHAMHDHGIEKICHEVCKIHMKLNKEKS